MGDFMPNGSTSPNPDLQLAILRFWAQAIDITRTFSQAEIKMVPELVAAISAVKLLPAAIGWEDDETDALIGPHPTGNKPN